MRLVTRTVAALALALALPTGAPGAAGAASATPIAANCAPEAASAKGRMVFNRRMPDGAFEAFIGDRLCRGRPLPGPHDGHRGAADITRDGRYVLLVTAVGWDRRTPGAEPGKGSQNAVQLLDRRSGRVRTLVRAACPGCARGVIWPKLSPDGRRLVWAEMLRTPQEEPAQGRWQLRVGRLDRRHGTLSDVRRYEDPRGGHAIYEPYGWIPRTRRVVFMSTTGSTAEGFQRMQLFSLPDTLPRRAPTRLTPPIAPSWSFQRASDAYHEFARFRPGRPHTLLTSVGTNTVGGADLFAYDLRRAGKDGMLGQPRRVSFFGGDLDAGRITTAVDGWPLPSYAVVGSMAWVRGGWSAAVCPVRDCLRIDAWRITG